MEKDLSVINESDTEKSDVSLSVLSVVHPNPEKSEVSNKTEDNYEFLKNFHSKYEKKEIESNSYQNFLKTVAQQNTNKKEGLTNTTKNANSTINSHINFNDSNSNEIPIQKNSRKIISENKEKEKDKENHSLILNNQTKSPQNQNHFSSFLSLLSNSTQRDSQTAQAQEISDRKNSLPEVMPQLPESPTTVRKGLILSKPEKDRRLSLFSSVPNISKSQTINLITSPPKSSTSSKLMRRNSMVEKNEPKNILDSKNKIVKNNSQFTLTTLNAGGGLKRRFTITENQSLFKFDTLPPGQEGKKSSENKKNTGTLQILDDVDAKTKMSSNTNNNINSINNHSPFKKDTLNPLNEKDNINNINIVNQTKELTLDKVVEEINKPYITFIKRRSSLSNTNFFNVDIEKIRNNTENENIPISDKKERFKTLTSKLTSFEQFNTNVNNNVKLQSQTSKIESSIFESKKKIVASRKVKNFRRIKIILHVFAFITFTKKEIITFGIKPKSRKPIIEREKDKDANSPLLRSEFSIVNFTTNENMNSYHILSEKNLATKSKIKCFIISPDEIFYKIWRRLHMCILIFFSIFTFYRMSFTDTYFNPENGFFYFVDSLVELIFMLEIMINIVLAFYDIEGNLIINFKKIVWSYFSSSWMILDICNLIPFIYISAKFFANGILEKASPINLLNLIRTVKLMLKVNNTIFLQTLQEKIFSQTIYLKLFIFLINTVIVCHTFACTFFYVYLLEGYSPDTWISRFKLEDESLDIIYLKVLYFSFTSFITVGYGDIVPFSNIEIIAVSCWLIFSGVFYTFSLSSLSKIFLDYSYTKFLLNNKCLIISETFKRANMPNKIKDEAVNYFKTSYSKNKEKVSVKDLKLILSEIPSNLKFNIASEMYNGSIMEIHIFSNCTKNFISNIGPHLQPLYLHKKLNVYTCDEVPQKIYFIQEGSVKFLTEDDISFSFLSKGTYFGEIEILRKTYRENTAQANSQLFLLTLSKSIIWEDIVSNYTEFFQILLENMIKRHNFMQKMRDLIDFLIEEGKKSASVNEFFYKKRLKLKGSTSTDGSNYNKYLFCLGLKNSKNTMNKSNILKLSQMFNSELIDAYSSNFTDNLENPEEEKELQPKGDNKKEMNNLDEIYNRIERRKITEKVINKKKVVNLIPTELEEIQKKEEQEDMFNENFKRMKKLHSVVERKQSLFNFNKNKENKENNNKNEKNEKIDYNSKLNKISLQNEEILAKLTKLLILSSSEKAKKTSNLLRTNSISNIDKFDDEKDIHHSPSRKGSLIVPQGGRNSLRGSLMVKRNSKFCKISKD